MPLDSQRTRRRAGLGGLALAVICGLVPAGACRGTLVRQYEYEEDLQLSLDGSATLYVNASIPALVALRGLPLDPDPSARLDRSKVRALYEAGGVRVSRVSAWRRNRRRFVSVRLDTDTVGQLARVAPLGWSTYRLDSVDDSYVYRQEVGPSAKTPVGAVGWTGKELVAFRLHVPSKIEYHNTLPANFERGNILLWEQPLSDRRAGVPLVMEVRMHSQSILAHTLWLFAFSGLVALTVFAAFTWWLFRRGAGPDRPAGLRGGAIGRG
jgi:hypothetical protein